MKEKKVKGISGSEGKKGERGKVSTRIYRIFEVKKRGKEVEFSSDELIVPGLIIYVERVGFFKVSKGKRTSPSLLDRSFSSFKSKRVHLTLIEKRKEKDSEKLKERQKVIISGNKGKRGRKGRAGLDGAIGATGAKGEAGKDGLDGKSISSLKFEEVSYLLPQQFFQDGKRGEQLLNLNFFRVFEGGKIRSSSQNVESSSQIFKVSKTCPPEMKILVGRCRWDLFKVSKKKSWCFSEDFSVGKRGCFNCISSLQSKFVSFEGEEKGVVTKLTFRTEKGKESDFEVNERSCNLLEASQLEERELGECGFFCFFQKT